MRKWLKGENPSLFPQPKMFLETGIPSAAIAPLAPTAKNKVDKTLSFLIHKLTLPFTNMQV